MVFILGGMIGSFLNVCVYRLPRGKSIVTPRSACPKCESLIAWYDNIPVVSWLVLGAKCRRCGEPISWQYPLVEALTATLFLLVYWRFGWVAATPVYLLVSASLVLVTFVDLTVWEIPNEVTFPGIPLGLLCAIVAKFFPHTGLLVESPLSAFGGMLLGGGVLYLLDKAALIFLKKPGMGFGDVKLLAMLGAFFGWQGVIFVMIVASFLGSGIGVTLLVISRLRGEEKEAHYLPFGPYLALGGIIHMLIGEQAIALYLGAFTPSGTMMLQ